MLPPLGITGIGCAFVNRRGGNRSFKVIQLPLRHGVELLTTYQGILGKRQEIVLSHTHGINLGVEVGNQLRRQQKVEPSGFVRPLFAYKNQYQMVHLLRVYPPCNHGHQPLTQKVAEKFLSVLSAFYLDRLSQRANMVCLFVPWFQMLQIIFERMEIGHGI